MASAQNYLIEMVFALQSNSDFIILFADDGIYTNMDINAPIILPVVEDKRAHTFGVALEPVDDALMYKRIGANNWRPGVLDLLGYLY